MRFDRKLSLLAYLAVPAVFLVYLLLQNLPPTGTLSQDLTFDHIATKLISFPYPGNRYDPVVKDANSYLLPVKSNLVYFDLTKPVANFDQITVGLQYRRPAEVPEVRLGLPRGPDQFQEILLSNQYLDGLAWPQVISKDNLTLWQRSGVTPYSTVEDFLAHPPKKAIMAIHQTAPTPQVNLPDYRAGLKTLKIPYELGGLHNFIVYLDNEPLKLSFSKSGPQSQTQETVKVLDFTSHEIVSLDVQANDHYEIDVPNLPAGRYKIDFNVAPSSIISGLQTTLSCLVVRDRLTLVGSAPAKLSLHSKKLIIQVSNPDSYQTISLGADKITIQQPTDDLSLRLPATSFDRPVEIQVPQGKLTLEAPSGYFTFTGVTKLFNPAPANSFSLTYQTTAADFERADYVLARYNSPKMLGNSFQENQIEFEPRSLYFDKDKKSWPFAILTPGLEQNCLQIWLRDISAKFERAPWSVAELTRLIKKIAGQ